MEQIPGVLKKHMIRQGQPCSLGGGQSAVRAAGRGSARIVEQADGKAVVEITCACGNTMYLNCTYGKQQ